MADDAAKRNLFIGGWLSDEFAAGRRPVYGYPSSRLPETDGSGMEVVTGYMAGAAGAETARSARTRT